MQRAAAERATAVLIAMHSLSVSPESQLYLAVRSLLISEQSLSTSPDMKLSSEVNLLYLATISLLISVHSLPVSPESHAYAFSNSYLDVPALSTYKFLFSPVA